MQKIANAKTLGAVHTRTHTYTHTPYLFKINVQLKESDNLVNKNIDIDKTKAYEKVVGY